MCHLKVDNHKNKYRILCTKSIFNFQNCWDISTFSSSSFINKLQDKIMEKKYFQLNKTKLEKEKFDQIKKIKALYGIYLMLKFWG